MNPEIENLMRESRWPEAQSACEKLLEEHPGNPKVNAYLGICLYRRSQFAQAAPMFRKAITLDPHFWEAGVKLAECLDRTLQYKEALQVAEHYLHMRPNDAHLKSLVNGLRRQDNAVEEESWQKSIKLKQHNVTLSQGED